MKKSVFFTLVFTTFILFAVSCSSGSTNAHDHSEMQKENTAVYYTCTMHPEIHSDQPGKCPKCGMELIEKEISESDSTHIHHDTESKKQGH